MQLLPLETPPPLTNSHWTCAGLSYLTEVPLNNFLLIHWIYKCKLPSTEFVCYIENKFKNSDSDASWRNPMWLSVYCFLYLFMFEIFHFKTTTTKPWEGISQDTGFPSTGASICLHCDSFLWDGKFGRYQKVRGIEGHMFLFVGFLYRDLPWSCSPEFLLGLGLTALIKETLILELLWTCRIFVFGYPVSHRATF